MMVLRPIPLRMLNDELEIMDGCEASSSIGRVRAELDAAFEPDGFDGHVAVGGRVYVDARNSIGARAVSPGTVVRLRGMAFTVVSCNEFEGAWGGVHHWELGVRGLADGTGCEVG